MRLRAIPLLVCGLLVMAGCNRDTATPISVPRSTGDPVPSAVLTKAAEQVTAKYLAAPEPTVLGTVKGQIAGSIGIGSPLAAPGTLDVLAVAAGPTSTLVKWRMSADPALDYVDYVTYGDPNWAVKDSSQVVLESKQANLRLHASHWYGVQPWSEYCTCALMPEKLGPTAGAELSSLYPALPASVTEVQVRVPGFPALTVPVTRK